MNKINNNEILNNMLCAIVSWAMPILLASSIDIRAIEKGMLISGDYLIYFDIMTSWFLKNYLQGMLITAILWGAMRAILHLKKNMFSDNEKGNDKNLEARSIVSVLISHVGISLLMAILMFSVVFWGLKYQLTIYSILGIFIACFVLLILAINLNSSKMPKKNINVLDVICYQGVSMGIFFWLVVATSQNVYINIQWDRPNYSPYNSVAVGTVAQGSPLYNLKIINLNEENKDVVVYQYKNKYDNKIVVDFSNGMVPEGVYNLEGEYLGKKFSIPLFFFVDTSYVEREAYINRYLNALRTYVKEDREVLDCFERYKMAYLSNDLNQLSRSVDEIKLFHDEIVPPIVKGKFIRVYSNIVKNRADSVQFRKGKAIGKSE